jgi:hypothetical protein
MGQLGWQDMGTYLRLSEGQLMDIRNGVELGGGATGSDVAYDAVSWDNNSDVQTKNAVRDKIEAIELEIAGITGFTYKGLLTLSSEMNLPAATINDVYIADGTSYWIGGDRTAGQYINAGDILICIATVLEGTWAQKGGSWNIQRKMISMPDGDRQIEAASNTSLTIDAGDNSLAVLANVWNKVENGVASPIGGPIEYVMTASGALPAANCYCGLLNNYGMTDADCTITLPAAAKGMSFLVVLGAARAKYWRLDPAAGDSIYLDGVTTGDGKYVGLAAAAIGKSIQFVAFHRQKIRY